MPFIEIFHRKQKPLHEIVKKLGQEEINKEKSRGIPQFDQEDIQKKQTELDKMVAIIRAKSEDKNSGVTMPNKGRIRSNLKKIYTDQQKAQESLPAIKKGYQELIADLNSGKSIFDADFSLASKPEDLSAKPTLLHKLRYSAPSSQNQAIKIASEASKESHPIQNAKETARDLRGNLHSKLDASDATLSDLSLENPRPAGEALELFARRKRLANNSERSEEQEKEQDARPSDSQTGNL